jgi:dienelactone hydrolase
MFSFKPLSVFVIGATVTNFVVDASLAASFNPAPLYDNFVSYSKVMADNGDETDIYYPIWEDATPVDDLPMVLFLQGALVDKSFYSEYASYVSRYGFVVVAPNHLRSLPGFGEGLFPEVSQIDAVLNTLNSENSDPISPLFGQIDTDKLGLLGHSFGGAVSLSVIANECIDFICFEPFERPSELMGGAFFGTSLRDQITAQPIPIPNDGIGVALLEGDQDGRILPFSAKQTFDNIATAPKALVTLAGVNHFGITNVNIVPGAIPDPNEQTLDQAVGIETIARWSGLFLRSTLLEDQGASDYVFQTGEALDPNVSSVEAVTVNDSSSAVATITLGLLLAAGKFRCQRPRQSNIASTN